MDEKVEEDTEVKYHIENLYRYSPHISFERIYNSDGVNLSYVTENRLRSVVSKFGHVNRKDLPKLIGLLAQDALKDFTDDFPSFKELEKEKQRKITQKLSPAARSLVESKSDDLVNGTL